MMTIDQAEALLSELRTRENAALNGEVAEWDAAYAVAYGAYRAERNFQVAGRGRRECACGSNLPPDSSGFCADCTPDFDAMERDPECLAKMRGPAYDALCR